MPLSSRFFSFSMMSRAAMPASSFFFLFYDTLRSRKTHGKTKELPARGSLRSAYSAEGQSFPGKNQLSRPTWRKGPRTEAPVFCMA